MRLGVRDTRHHAITRLHECPSANQARDSGEDVVALCHGAEPPVELLNARNAVRDDKHQRVKVSEDMP
jgi:hypothetical protein